MEILIPVGISLFFLLCLLRKMSIDTYKMAYYKQKLENRYVDISSVENIGLIDILKS